MNKIKTKLTLLTALSMAVFLSGCTTQYVKQDNSTQPKKPMELSDVGYVLNNENWNPEPKCIIVMPFAGEATDLEKKSIVRKGVYTHLFTKGYHLPSLDKINDIVAQSESSSSRIVATKLNCDYALTGTITQFSKNNFLIMSEINLGANLAITRVSDNKVLWQGNYTSSLKDGGLPLSPIATASSIFMASKQYADDQTLRAVDDFARKIVRTIPESTGYDNARPELQKWRMDISGWVQAIPEIDRVPQITQLLNRTDLTTVQRETLYNRLTRLSDDQYHAVQWAQSRMENGDYAGSLELLSKVGFTNTKNPEVLYLKGRALLSLKRYDEADKMILSAINLNKNNPDYYNALAYVSSSMGQHSRASAALSKSIKINANQPYTWYNIAISRYNNEMYEDALESFVKSALLYKKSNQDLKVSKIVKDITDMKKYLKKEKITQALKKITT